MRLSRSGIGLSVLLHMLGLYGLMHWALHAPRRTAELQAAIIWYAPHQHALEPAPAPPSPADRSATTEPASESTDSSRVEVAPRRTEHTAPPARERAARPTPTQPPEPAIAPAPATPPAAPARGNASVPNLVEARRRAAVDVLEERDRGDAHRSFAFPGTIAQQRAFDESERVRRRERGLQPPLTAFDSEAKGRAGLPEEPMGPFGVHWVSDDCYVFREPLDRFVLPGLFREPTTCTHRLVRTDLFTTAKPRYLMRDEEWKAVDAETQRRELLRRPTTGAVTPLEKD
jgi:hypothetical protein